ncbi:hypothetical protein ASF00_04255 [Sphingomonas sp. Leaf34]|jgi:hypothetical protein|nr:hypothetical protein ASF00_04255 [Sphingomonas sp. Leaf34]
MIGTGSVSRAAVPKPQHAVLPIVMKAGESSLYRGTCNADFDRHTEYGADFAIEGKCCHYTKASLYRCLQFFK